MIVITSKMIGIIVLLSLLLAFRTSLYTALVPPTNDVSSAALASSRILGMSFEASTLSGALSSVTFKMALLLTTFITLVIGSAKGTISVTPGAFLTATVTASILSTATTI